MSSDNFLGRSQDDDCVKTSDIAKIKKEFESADEKFYDELATKYFLLNKFSVEQLREMCNNLLGKGPDVEYYQDEHTKKIIELPQYKEDFIYFIIDEFQLDEIKDYAHKQNIFGRYYDNIE